MDTNYFDNLVKLYSQDGIKLLRKKFFNDARGEQYVLKLDDNTVNIGSSSSITGEFINENVYYFHEYVEEKTLELCQYIEEESTKQIAFETSPDQLSNIESYISNTLKTIILPHADIFIVYPSAINPIIELINFFKKVHHIAIPNYFDQVLPKALAEQVMPDYDDQLILENLSPLLIGKIRAKGKDFPIKALNAIHSLAKKLRIISETEVNDFKEVLLCEKTDKQIIFTCSGDEIGLFLHCIKDLYIKSRFSNLSDRFISKSGTIITQTSFNKYQSKARQKIRDKDKLFLLWENEFSKLIKSII